MFWPDVVELKEFYHSRLGQVACRLIRKQIEHFWPECKGDAVLGLGYATPYLLPFSGNDNVAMACMPAAQGVVHWPQGEPNLAFLSDEAQLPIGDNRINRVLLVHAMENSEHVRLMLQEVWRVLAPAGRVLAIVPNRSGIWARAQGSPFAYGQPFSAAQLRRLLGECQFTPTQTRHALFLPPTSGNMMLKSAQFLETAGSWLFAGFGGVMLMEAEKRIYSPTRQAVPVRAQRRVPAAAPQPAMTFKKV